MDVPIPAAAMTAATRFRWRQPVFTAAGQDTWQLDDVSVGVENSTGLSLAWTPNSNIDNVGIQTPQAWPTATGWYYVNSTDSGTQCTYSDSVHIDVGLPFTLAMTPDTSICDITGIQLHADPSIVGNYTYLWTPNTDITSVFASDPVVTPSGTTTYNVVVTSDEGCEATGDVQIIVAAALDLTVTTTDNDICAGDVITLNANVNGATGMAYDWSPSASLDDNTIQSPQGQPMQDVWYSVVATDTVSGCVLADSVFINVTNVQGVFAGNDTTVCDATGLQLHVTGTGPVFHWQPAQFLNFPNTASPIINTDTTATYIVEVGDGVNCSAFDTITVTVLFEALTFIADSSLCQGQVMTLDAGFPTAQHAWSTGDTTQTIDVDAAGDYTCTLTNTLMGCSVSFTSHVTVDPLPVITLGPDTSLCIGQSWTLNALNPGSAALWNTSATTHVITVSTDDDYWVQITDNNDCVNRDTINVTFDPLPVIVLADTAVCVSDTITLDAGNAGSYYLWSPNGETTQTISVNTASGIYSVVVTTPTVCIDSANASLTFIPFAVVDLGPDTALCDTQELLLDAGNDTCIVHWSTGAMAHSITLTDDADIWVTVFNDYCTTTDSVHVVFN
ncbi:MAG TPA: hypothetical protein PK760_09215, partial [Flavobacteriales bacterium]|nr:hypothetical protein [Flavobacteriales bacterium]